MAPLPFGRRDWLLQPSMMIKVLIFLISGVCIGAIATLVAFQTGDRVGVYAVLAVGTFVQLFVALALDLI